MAPPDMIPDLISEKKSFRKKAKARRSAAAKEAHEREMPAAMALIQSFKRLNIAVEGRVVSGYLPIGSEIDVVPLMLSLQKVGAKLCLPCVLEADRPLEFRAWSFDDALVQEDFGTKAPAPDKPVVRPDILLAPLLAFDPTGYRLGYGGGFYDRTVEALDHDGEKPLVIGCAFDKQEFPEVPRDAHDQSLDAVITETRALTF